MDQTRLHQLLADLHRELGHGPAVDPQSRRMLEQLLEDIRRLPEGGSGAPEGATAQLEEAALRLEAEHPRLASVLGQIADALAKLGI
jgi:hypothetical protein